MNLKPLCPDPAAWCIRGIAPAQDRIVLHLESIRSLVACPVCGTLSRRVHSRYCRQPWDLPWERWPARLVVHARRFFCDAPECPRRIFVAPFPGVLAPYARQTERWRQVLLELAHASSAEVDARVAWWLGYRVSPDTLIRRQRAEFFIFSSPQVLGVDEFAIRRGRTYGTLLVDLQRRQPVAVLEGRMAEPLTQWLHAHPSVAIFVRDRADTDALAGRLAVPDALQVADRFHLVRNVGDALKTLVHSRRWQQPTTAETPGAFPLDSPAIEPASLEERQQVPQPTPRKRAAWEAVQQRKAAGQSIRHIARELGLDRRTVRTSLAADRPPVYSPRCPRPTQLDRYRSYLCQRWARGCHNARQLYQELIPRGYRGSESQVRAAVRPWRAEHGPLPQRAPSLPSLVLRPGTQLTEAEQQALEDILQANPFLARGYQLKERFQAVVARRDVTALDQ